MALDHRLVVPPHGGGAVPWSAPTSSSSSTARSGWPRSRVARSGSAAAPIVRPQPAAPRLRADRRRGQRSGLLPARRTSCPGSASWPARVHAARGLPVDADGAAGRHAPRCLGDAERLRRPPGPARHGHRRGASGWSGSTASRRRSPPRPAWTPSSSTPTTTTSCSGSSRRSPTIATTSTAARFEGRRRLLREVVESIRAHVDRPITLGLRLCLDEMIDGGYGLDECQAMVAAFTAEGTVDYFSLDVGNNWGVPSYIPVACYEERAVGAAVRPGQGGHLPAGRVRRARAASRPPPSGSSPPGRPTSSPWPGPRWPTRRSSTSPAAPSRSATARASA